MKILIKIFGYIYMYSIMWMIDLIFLVFNSIIYLIRKPVFPDNIPTAKQLKYKKDPLGGALNYNWLFPFQAYICNLQGDCDKYATLWKWQLIREKAVYVNRYTIIHKKPLKLPRAHVVTEAIVRENIHHFYIYSLDDQFRDESIKRFVEKRYGKDWIYLKMPY